MTDHQPRVPVRTFKPRRRRMSTTRASAFERLLPRHGLEVEGDHIDFAGRFGADTAVTIEIGSGAGEAALEMSRLHPDRHHIAIDVHTPGIARLLAEVERLDQTNLSVVHGDALEFLRRVPDESVTEFHLWFPDPWPKVRQAPRRLVQRANLECFARLLVPGGTIRLATDIDEYAAFARQDCAQVSTLRWVTVERAHDRPITRFERKGLDAGRQVTDVEMVRVDVAAS